VADELSTRDLAATSGDTEAATDEPLARDSETGRTVTDDGDRRPLFDEPETASFTTRWREIQVDFVDRPRESVEEADALVAELMQRLAGSFADERGRLEQQWDGGDDVSTEDLRVALTRYRSFFGRLLSA
jgi:hypothetical protein